MIYNEGRNACHQIRLAGFFVFVGWRNSLLEINVDIYIFLQNNSLIFFSLQEKNREKNEQTIKTSDSYEDI